MNYSTAGGKEMNKVIAGGFGDRSNFGSLSPTQVQKPLQPGQLQQLQHLSPVHHALFLQQQHTPPLGPIHLSQTGSDVGIGGAAGKASSLLSTQMANHTSSGSGSYPSPGSMYGLKSMPTTMSGAGIEGTVIFSPAVTPATSTSTSRSGGSNFLSAFNQAANRQEQQSPLYGGPKKEPSLFSPPRKGSAAIEIKSPNGNDSIGSISKKPSGEGESKLQSLGISRDDDGSALSLSSSASTVRPSEVSTAE